jgi:hypothetical protein
MVVRLLTMMSLNLINHQYLSFRATMIRMVTQIVGVKVQGIRVRM